MRCNVLFLFVFLSFCSANELQIHETVNVDLVEVFVSVLDSNEHPVEDLSINDFVLKVDGKNETITHFSRILDPESDVPLTIVFLVDTSGSMKVARRIELAKIFALSVMKDIKPKDQMQVMSFDVQLRMLTPMTSNSAQIDQALSDLQIDPARNTGTALLAALQFVPGLIEKQMGRKLIVLLSDGQESFARIKADDVVEILNKHAITILALGTTDIQEMDRQERERIESPLGAVRSVMSEGDYHKAKRLLRNLAEKTGGYAYFPIDEDQLSRTMEKFRHITRSQYMLGFKPTKSSGKSKIEVNCTRKNLKLRYRKSYIE